MMAILKFAMYNTLNRRSYGTLSELHRHKKVQVELYSTYRDRFMRTMNYY